MPDDIKGGREQQRHWNPVNWDLPSPLTRHCFGLLCCALLIVQLLRLPPLQHRRISGGQVVADPFVVQLRLFPSLPTPFYLFLSLLRLRRFSTPEPVDIRLRFFVQ